MILMIDNFASFTYNIVQYLGELKQKIAVFRNDAVGIDQIKKIAPTHIVISPGPGSPKDAGISKKVISNFSGKIPILGVCLGHQAVAEVFGGKVTRAKRLMHGKTSMIYHNKKTIFKGLPNPFEATRYHSLIVEKRNLPSCFSIIAKTKENEIMGIKHKKKPVWGVQFHPESILTKEGKKLLGNFVNSV